MNELSPARMLPDLLAWFFIALFMLGSVPTLESYLGNPDHGYQLSLGRQVLLGATPFVDLISHYGPMTALTSAAMFSVHDSLIPETILCAILYACALVLLFRIVRVYSGASSRNAVILGTLAVGVSLRLTGRFYKWYFWLFPMLCVGLLCEAYAEHRNAGQRAVRVAVAGFVAGVAALYRLDLGAACLVPALATVGLFAVDAREFRRGVGLGVLVLVSFLIPFGGWHVLLVAQGGDPSAYVAAFFGGASGVVDARGLPFPRFEFAKPFAEQSGLFLALGLAATTYGAVLAWACWRALRSGERLDERAAAFAILALFGTALFPQALHRFSAEHFVTVALPFYALAFCLAATGWRWSATRGAILRGAVATAIGLSLAAGGGLDNGIHHDIAPFGVDVVERYRGLREGPEHYLATIETPERRREIRARNEATLVRLVHRYTLAGDTVLPHGIVPGCYYFERRLAGYFPRYVSGIFDSGNWRERELERVSANPPALIVVPLETNIINPGATIHDALIAENYVAPEPFQPEGIPYRLYFPKETDFNRLARLAQWRDLTRTP